MRLTIPVEGGVLAADDSGGGGPPLLLVHAGWADQSSWADVAGLLAGRYRIISYDARGYGASPPPQAPFSQLADLVTVLDHVGVQRATMVGHSGGGGTTIGLALASPERVAGLVLLAPGVQDYPWPMDDPYNTKFMALATAGDRAGPGRAGPADLGRGRPGGCRRPGAGRRRRRGHVRAGRLRAARPARLLPPSGDHRAGRGRRG